MTQLVFSTAKTVVRPYIMYGSKCWAMDGTHEQIMSFLEMRMLREMRGMTRKNRRENEYMRGSKGVQILDKMPEKRLNKLGHILKKV